MPNFNSRAELLRTADRVIRGRMGNFRKDTNICLRPDANRQHAYMPALIACIAFMELMSGWRRGRLNLGRGAALPALQDLRAAHLPQACYAAPNLEILYLGFRHRIAHIGLPYAVYDTTSDGRLASYPRMKVTWTFCARRRHGAPAIEFRNVGPSTLDGRVPWPIPYDHRLFVCITRFRADLFAAARSYRRALRQDASLQANFDAAMGEYCPR